MPVDMEIDPIEGIKRVFVNADKLDWFFLAFLGAVIFFRAGVGSIYGESPIQLIEAAVPYTFSAIIAFVAVYRLRRPQDAYVPAVRPAFENTEIDSQQEFGLKNFGPGAALYFQLKIVVEETEETVFEFPPSNPPLHLPEGELLGVIYDDRLPNGRLLERIQDGEGTLEFHYSYVSASGVREPVHVKADDDENILSELDSRSPRKVEIDDIRGFCTGS